MTDIAKKHKEARDNFFSQLSVLASTTQWNKNLFKEIEKKTIERNKREDFILH